MSRCDISSNTEMIQKIKDLSAGGIDLERIIPYAFLDVMDVDNMPTISDARFDDRGSLIVEFDTRYNSERLKKILMIAEIYNEYLEELDELGEDWKDYEFRSRVLSVLKSKKNR